MNTKETLIAAKQLLIDTDWCQGSFATDKQGNSVESISPQACAFCSVGAINRVTNHEGGSAVMVLQQAVAPCSGVSIWNDAPYRTKEEVLQGFDKALGILGN